MRLTTSVSALLCLFFAGCPEAELAALPDWSEGYPDGIDTEPEEDPNGEGQIRMRLVSNNLGWDTRLHLTNNPSEPCEVNFDDTSAGYRDIECTLDSNELDLHVGGMSFDLDIEGGACEWVSWSHYMYARIPTDLGADTVYVTIDSLGNKLTESHPVDELFLPVCTSTLYDYERDEVVACCEGRVDVEVTNVDNGDVYTGWRDFGRPFPACYGGAAFLEPSVDKDPITGMPLEMFELTNSKAFLQTFQFDAPGPKGYKSSVGLANYYDPADHGGGMPIGFTTGSAVPEYTYRCLDHAEEDLAIIRLTVKEWNEEAEFLVAGDAETTGTESGSGGPIDDIFDWAILTPGANEWVGSQD